MFDRSKYEPKQLILASLRGMARELDPALLSCDDAVGLMEYGAAVERLGGAIKTIAAGRAGEGDAWRRAGARSPADWLAKQTGSTVGEARSVLATAAKLADAPATDAALRAGELSARQAAAIAPAAAADPAAEGRLLELARTQALQKLTDECARVRAAADPDPRARHARIRRDRFWKKWSRADGSRAGMYAGTPEEVALFEAHAQAFIDERLDRARRNGESEPSEAYAFDALMAAMAAAAAAVAGATDDAKDGNVDDDVEVTAAASDEAATACGDDGQVDGDVDRVDDAASEEAATGCGDATAADDAGADERDGDGGSGAASAAYLRKVRAARGGRGRKRLRERRELFAMVDLAALRRGSLVPGETCEIPGVGPVPLDVAIDVFGDSLLRVVIRDGVDVRTVVHAGRAANSVQETAVFVAQRGRCAVKTCGSAIAEIDHAVDWSVRKQTTLPNLVGLCGHHHDLKTRGHTRPPPLVDTS